MSNLIVDFPHRRNSYTRPEATEHGARILVDFPHGRNSYIPLDAERKGVTFSSTNLIQARHYRCPDETDTSKLFYRDEEYEAMRAERVQAVRDAHEAFHSNSSQDLDFTGLENLLTPELVRKLLRRRNRVRRAVLAAQARQGERGEEDVNIIAWASYHHSKTSARQAAKIASFTAEEVRSTV